MSVLTSTSVYIILYEPSDGRSCSALISLPHPRLISNFFVIVSGRTAMNLLHRCDIDIDVRR